MENVFSGPLYTIFLDLTNTFGDLPLTFPRFSRSAGYFAAEQLLIQVAQSRTAIQHSASKDSHSISTSRVPEHAVEQDSFPASHGGYRHFGWGIEKGKSHRLQADPWICVNT